MPTEETGVTYIPGTTTPPRPSGDISGEIARCAECLDGLRDNIGATVDLCLQPCQAWLDATKEQIELGVAGPWVGASAELGQMQQLIAANVSRGVLDARGALEAMYAELGKRPPPLRPRTPPGTMAVLPPGAASPGPVSPQLSGAGSSSPADVCRPVIFYQGQQLPPGNQFEGPAYQLYLNRAVGNGALADQLLQSLLSQGVTSIMLPTDPSCAPQASPTYPPPLPPGTPTLPPTPLSPPAPAPQPMPGPIGIQSTPGTLPGGTGYGPAGTWALPNYCDNYFLFFRPPALQGGRCGAWSASKLCGAMWDPLVTFDDKVGYATFEPANAEAARRNQALTAADGGPCWALPPSPMPPIGTPPPPTPPPIGTPPPPDCPPCPPPPPPKATSCPPVDRVSWVWDPCSDKYKDALRALVPSRTRDVLGATTFEQLEARLDQWVSTGQVPELGKVL